MVIAIAAIGGGSLVLSSFFFGLYLVWKSSRTRGLPEFCLGMGLFLMGGIGYSLTTISTTVPDLPLGLRYTFNATSMLCSVAGHSLIALFTYTVFQRGVGWARILAGSVFGLFSILFIWQLLSPGLAANIGEQQGPWTLTTYLTFVNLTWAASESFRFYMKMRRRRSLGLADPRVSNQVLMWAIAIGSAAAVVAAMVLVKASGIPTAGKEGLVTTALIVGPMGPISAVCMGLAFMPPRWYARWLAGESVPQPA